MIEIFYKSCCSGCVSQLGEILKATEVQLILFQDPIATRMLSRIEVLGNIHQRIVDHQDVQLVDRALDLRYGLPWFTARVVIIFRKLWRSIKRVERVVDFIVVY